MTTRQLSLFDRPPEPIPARGPSVAPEARPRLSRQCLAILERLRRGTATNRELAEIALKYTGRISDLRAAGYVAEKVSHDHESGLTVYALRHEPD